MYTIFDIIFKVIIFLNFCIAAILCQNSVEIKRYRRPTRFDNILCRQKNTGPGIRSSAVLNYSGELCKTYCRITNRITGTASVVEYLSPNNLRCGLLGARCVEGVCQTVSSGPIGESSAKPLINGNRVDLKRRLRPGRKGSTTRQKTTSLSTIEFTDSGPTETATSDVIVDQNQNEETDSIKAKIVFPND